MAERLAEVEERLASIHELQGLVGAMRAMAAARVQQAQAALRGIRAYADVVEAALARSVALLPPPGRAAAIGRARQGVVLFCAEHGFAGAFSQRVLDRLEAGRGAPEGLFVVGSRGAMVAEERGLRAAWTLPMATQVGAVPRTARRIAEELYRRFSAGALQCVDVAYTRPAGGGLLNVERRTLLPVDLERIPPAGRSSPPLTNLPPPVLLERLIEEHFYAQLVHAATESLASENAARLATTQSARTHIEEKLEELGGVARRLRQEQITTELLDVVTGAEAIRGGPPGPDRER